MKFWHYLLLCALPVLAGNQLQAGSDSLARKYASTITEQDLIRHLEIISSDEFEGRETGTEGQKKAAAYISSYFKELGLPPIVDGGYYQPIPLNLRKVGNSKLSFSGKDYAFLEDFYHFRDFDDTLVNAEQIVFLGYGIDDAHYSDYSSEVDIKGKVVLILDGQPKKIKGGKKLAGNWTPSIKADLAGQKGAAAVLVVRPGINGTINRLRSFYSEPTISLEKPGQKKGGEGPLLFFVSEGVADDILARENKSWTKLKKRIDKKGSSVPIHLSGKIAIEVDIISEKLESENVLGFVEGNESKDEIVVVTAHYDHLGKRGDQIYNGADDDGSGTAAILEMAEAFQMAKNNGEGPKRSLLFMAVSAEEKGLLGSEHYASKPVFPLKNTVADLNIDMIGRTDDRHETGEYVYLIGSDRLSKDLHNISEEVNEKFTQLELDYTYNREDDPQRLYYRSDHYNFAKNGIPVIFYFSGIHEDYHRPTDTIEKIEFEKMKKIIDLVFHTAWELANREERIRVDVKNGDDDAPTE